MLAPAVYVGGGAATGGALGQALHALSYPRRALWSALGGPESGAELVGEHLGIDPEAPLSQVLGFGAEVAGDPLTWGGGLLGRGVSALSRALGRTGRAG